MTTQKIKEYKTIDSFSYLVFLAVQRDQVVQLVAVIRGLTLGPGGAVGVVKAVAHERPLAAHSHGRGDIIRSQSRRVFSCEVTKQHRVSLAVEGKI